MLDVFPNICPSVFGAWVNLSSSICSCLLMVGDFVYFGGFEYPVSII